MDQVLLGGMIMAAAMVMSIASVALLGLAVPYVVVRLKAEPPEDTQLGAKVAFQFFYSAGILVILSGVTILAADWLTLYPYRHPRNGHPLGRTSFGDLVGENFNVAQRTAVGLIICGVMAVVAHFLLLHAMSATHRLRIQRLFVGFRLAIHGVVVMLALSAVVILVLQKEPFEEPVESPLRAATATLVVWGVSWGLHLERLITLTKRRKREQDSAAPAAARPTESGVPPELAGALAAKGVAPPTESVSPAVVSIVPADVSIRHRDAADKVPPAPDEPILFTPGMSAASEPAPLDLETPLDLSGPLDLTAPLTFPGDENRAAAPETPRAEGAPPLPSPLAPASDADPLPEIPAEKPPEKPADSS